MTDVPVQYYNQNAADTDAKLRWWLAPKVDKAKNIFAVITRITDNQKYRELNDIRFARLYHNMELVSLRSGMFARTAAQDTRLSNRVTFNVVKSCIDTVSSKIAKNKPRPMFLTIDGDWGLQHKAQLLTKYIEGLFDHQGAYEIAQRCFIDACVFGTGIMKIYPGQDGQICFERTIANEITVDETEGRYGKPQQMFQTKLMFRDVLMDLFPEFKEKIKMAPSGLNGDELKYCAADMVKVVEAWHLPSGVDAMDGRHTMAVENLTLLDEEYNKDYFPFVFLRWTPKLLGFYGMGLAEELIGIQLELNKLLRNIQIAQHLMAVPQIWLEANSHVVTAHLNNEIGGIKNYVGNPPIFMIPNAMNAEIYQWVETLFQKAYRITGISEMSASAQKPSGVTAAVAMRELTDIESDRFMLISQSYEQFFMNAAEIAIKETRSIFEEFPDLEVKMKGAKFMEKIRWDDIDLDDEMYTMRVFPTSLLPSTPAGKLQKVQELMQAGFLDRDESLSLLDFPDTDKVTTLKTAARENIIRIVDKMIVDGKYTSLEPFMNVQFALQYSQNAYNKAQLDGVSPQRLELLINFMTECSAKLNEIKAAQQQEMMAQQAAMQPPGMPGPGMPGPAALPQGAQAVPQGPPQSELIPNGGFAS